MPAQSTRSEGRAPGNLLGDSQRSTAPLGRGSIFGVVVSLGAGARSADALNATPTELFGVPMARFGEVVAACPEEEVMLLSDLARSLPPRLRHTKAAIRAIHKAKAGSRGSASSLNWERGSRNAWSGVANQQPRAHRTAILLERSP